MPQSLYCMKVTGLAIVPPPAAAGLPRVTPELLASVLARYSRSNEGLAAILAKVDPANPDASIDRILKFVDYGHASIGGLTGGLAVALDGVSMWLAYKLFEIAQMADGQESSTGSPRTSRSIGTGSSRAHSRPIAPSMSAWTPWRSPIPDSCAAPRTRS